MDGRPTVGTGVSRFADVDSGLWSTPFVERLADIGITSGCAVGPLRFCPDEPVTRGQMATFLTRALDLVPRAEILGRYTDIATGNNHACGLRANGTITCWGSNDNGTTEPPPGTYTSISAGGLLNCALHVDGHAVCWGYADGQARVAAGRYTAVSADHWFGCGLDPDGSLTCWGRNPWADSPVELPGGRFTAVSTGSEHSCAVRAEGTIACWGNNDNGQADAPGGRFTTIAGGYSHSCGLLADGTVACWGDFYGSTSPPQGSSPPCPPTCTTPVGCAPTAGSPAGVDRTTCG